MLMQTTSSSAPPWQPASALRVLLLEDTVSLPQIEDRTPTDLTAVILTPLHRQLTALCLHNPYWSDFRLLNHFQKRGISMTLSDLEQLKKECKVDDRETICNTLVHLSTQGGLHLNSRQISFIERAKPEFRDRDLLPSRPGELLVYGRLFGRGLGDFGRVYLHTFIDMHTGHVFSKLSQDRSVATGLAAFNSTVVPIYQSRNYTLDTVLHSTQDANDLKEFNLLENTSDFSSLGLQWLPTTRSFGVLEKFDHHFVQNGFFDCSPDFFSDLQTIFEHRLARYNASNRLFARRTLVDY